jgi:hypothetical protein
MLVLHAHHTKVSLDPESLLASLAVSSIGWVLFSYGRKIGRPPQVGVGLVMLIYPYFVSNVVWMLALVPVLLLCMWLLIKLGI